MEPEPTNAELLRLIEALTSRCAVLESRVQDLEMQSQAEVVYVTPPAPGTAL